MKFKPFRTARLRGLLIGIICAAICWLLNQNSVIRNLENWSLDLCFVVRDMLVTPTEQPAVIIIALDNDWFHSYPKPKMHITPEMTQVIRHVQQSGARVVGVDLMIPDAVHAIEQLQSGKPGDAFTLGELRRPSAGIDDRDSNEPCPIVIPEMLSRVYQQENGNDPESDSIAQTDDFVFPIRQWHGSAMLETIDSMVQIGFSPDEKSAYETLALFDQPWNETGCVNTSQDNDGSLRRQMLRFPILTKDQTVVYEPSFAVAVLASAENLDESFLESLKFPTGESVPLQSKQMIINFRYKKAFQRVPFLEVLAEANQSTGGSTSKSKQIDWNNQIVLIGETYNSSPDRKSTPFNNQSVVRMMWSQNQELMPGVEVHANTIQTLVDRRFITTPFWLSTAFLLIVWGAMLGMVLMRVNLETGLLITFIHHWFWKAVCISAFILFDWQIEMVSVLTLGVLVFGVAFSLRWRWIRKMMGMVKSEAIARALEEDPSKLDLKGEERVITVLFSDIRSFTTFSENHTAHEVVKLLNEYFGVVVPIIEKHGGVVNQYMGDGVMVMFNAPREQNNHASHAVRAAIEMVTAVHQHKQNWARLDAPDLRIGVGVHTGNCVIGTVGSPNRLDYTAIGDTTNTAARIEAGNKELETEILASAATVAAIDSSFTDLKETVGPPQPLSVKGKQMTLTVHEILLPQKSVD